MGKWYKSKIFKGIVSGIGTTGILILSILIRVCVWNALKTQKYSLRLQKGVKNKIGK